MTSFTPWEAATVSQMGSGRDALDIAHLVVMIADGSESHCGQIAQSLRDLGVRDVAQVRSLAPALEQLGRRATDVLICGERLLDHHGAVLIAAVRRVSPATRTLLLPDHDGSEGSERDHRVDRNPSMTDTLLKTVLQSAVAAQGAFWCKVPDLSLADILQLYHQLRRSVTVLLSGRVAGRVRLEHGELVHAESEDQLGAAALCRLLDADSGLIRTDTSPFDGVQTITGRFHRVLLDAMDVLDAQREVRRAELLRNPSHTGDGGGLEAPRDQPLDLPDATAFDRGKTWPRLGTISLLAGGLAAAASLYALVTTLSEDTARTPPDVVRHALEPVPVVAVPVPEVPVGPSSAVDNDMAPPGAVPLDQAVTPEPARRAEPPVRAPSAPASSATPPRAPVPPNPALDIRLER